MVYHNICCLSMLGYLYYKMILLSVNHRKVNSVDRDITCYIQLPEFQPPTPNFFTIEMCKEKT